MNFIIIFDINHFTLVFTHNLNILSRIVHVPKPILSSFYCAKYQTHIFFVENMSLINFDANFDHIKQFVT